MTRKRNDDKSMEFGLWLRSQEQIDSKLGYVATNVDYLWRSYKTDKWMLIEEKRFGRSVPLWQSQCFKILDLACSRNRDYLGFHMLIFENTNPDDGKMWWDGKEIDKDELLEILAMDSK